MARSKKAPRPLRGGFKKGGFPQRGKSVDPKAARYALAGQMNPQAGC